MKFKSFAPLTQAYMAILMLLLLTTACAPAPFQQTLKVKKALPTQFNTALTDTAYALPTWKNFFTDSILQSYIEAGLKDNFDLAIVDNRMMQAAELFKQTKWLNIPKIAFSTGVSGTKFGRYTMEGVGNFDTNLSQNISSDEVVPTFVPNYIGGLESSWELGLWGKFRNMKKAARYRYLSSQEGRTAYANTLVSAIAVVYYHLMFLDREFEILNKNAELQAKVLELVRAQKEGGLSNELAIKQVHAQLLNTKAIAKEVEQNILQTELELSQLLGKFPFEIKRANYRSPAFGDSLTRLASPEAMLSRRPDIRAAEWEFAASGADVQAARAAFYPQLRFTAYGALHSFTFEKLMQTPASLAYQTALGLVSPLLSGREIRTAFNISKLSQEQAALHYNKTVVAAYAEVLSGVFGIANAKAVSSYKEEEVELLQQASSFALDLYATASANYIEVITVQRNVLLAELEAIAAQKKLAFQHIALFKALGGGV
jgi:NodT family efflux transporter outer membrane factor (OMF) lipoprotein